LGEDAREVLREAADELGLAVAREPISREGRDPWALPLAQLERAVERCRLQNARGESAPADYDVLDGEVLAELSLVYERRLEAHAAVDYPSMLTLPLRLLEENRRASRMLQDAYRWLLVDEYQDCCSDS
jgi:superfamily I DNA/RNA helicase